MILEGSHLSRLFNLLLPREACGSVLEIEARRLREAGIRGVILDLDNTLREWRGGPLSEEVAAWLRGLAEAGLGVCLVSNNNPRKVAEVADAFGFPYVARAQKPRRKSFRRALGLLGTRPEETAVVGDQLFTDVLGGNRLGLYTILVAPLSRKEFVGTRFVRLLEKLVFALQKRARGGKGGSP